MATRRKRSQRLYKMKGCNKKTKSKSKRYLGGSNNMDRIYPSKGIEPGNFGFLNPQVQRGGCGCGMPSIFSGGSAQKGGCCGMSSLSGGSAQKGGAGNGGIPYPNGLVGTSWTSNASSWPGVDGVSGNSNHYAQNTFKNGDPQLEIKYTGAQPPFLGGGRKRNKTNKKQRGGNLSNFLTQDLINLGRQFQYGVGTAYNGITGYSAPVSPLPWKGQMPNTPSFASVKAMM